MRTETKLEGDRQRWEALMKEDEQQQQVQTQLQEPKTAACLAISLGAGMQGSSNGTEQCGKIIYAKKKLRDNKWETKVYVASTLCAIGKALLLNEDGMVQELFVQKFGREEEEEEDDDDDDDDEDEEEEEEASGASSSRSRKRARKSVCAKGT